ncbi:MAG: hypothetical protein ACYC26_03290 [Phycisphaerales bacterium]
MSRISPNRCVRILPALLAILFVTVPRAQAGDGGHADHQGMDMGKTSAKAAWTGDPYPLATDPVTGEQLPEYAKQVIIQHDGRELRFASQANADAFNKEPGKYLPAVDAQIIKEQLPYYPLTACLVSGEKLGGEMGDAINFVYKNRLIRFCCPDCKKDFLAAPDKYLAKLDEAVIAKQKPAYPFTECMISGDKLGGDMGPPVDRIYANHLVRFCCPMCIRQFKENPAKYLKKIDDAARKKSADSKPESSNGAAKNTDHSGHKH